MKKINNALVNETTAATATATLETPIVEAVATPTAAKPKQFIVGASEKGKQFIYDLCKELKVKGKTGKLIELPSHAAIDMLLEIATDFRFHEVETSPAGDGVEAVTEVMDRFEAYRAKYEQERNSERPQTKEELQAELARIQAKLQSLFSKA